MTFKLRDLAPYVQQYGLPLDESTNASCTISTIGSIVWHFVYERIEFKINCRMAMEDRLLSSCASLLPFTALSSCHCNQQNKKVPSCLHTTQCDFFVALNIRNAHDPEHGALSSLFAYPNYTQSTRCTEQRGIKMDFLAQKPLKCMVMGTFVKETSSSSQPSWTSVSKSATNAQQSNAGAIPVMMNRACSANPYQRSHRPRANTANAVNNLWNNNSAAPMSIPAELAIIYDQDNMLYAYYHNKHRVIENMQFLPILSLWRQSESNIVYMLRGHGTLSNTLQSDGVECSSTSSSVTLKKRQRSWSAKSHTRNVSETAPVPNVSTLEKELKKKKPTMPLTPNPSDFRRRRKKAKSTTSRSRSRSKTPRARTVSTTCVKQSRQKIDRHSKARSQSGYDDNVMDPDDSENEAPEPSPAAHNYLGNNIYKQQNEVKKPCKFYRIEIGKHDVVCRSVFDFPFVNVQHELTWFDERSKSLLLVLNHRASKTFSLQIVRQRQQSVSVDQKTPPTVSDLRIKTNNNNNNKHTMQSSRTFSPLSRSPLTSLSQSASVAEDDDASDEESALFAFAAASSTTVKLKHRKTNQRQQSLTPTVSSRRDRKSKQGGDSTSTSSQKFHMKLQNECERLIVSPPAQYAHLFTACQCLKLWHHQPLNAFILLLEKKQKEYEAETDNGDGGLKMDLNSLPLRTDKMLLKLKINFGTAEIEHIAFAAMTEQCNDFDIIGYDYDRQLVLTDTKYEPISPLATNANRIVHSNRHGIKRSKISPPSAPAKAMYKQYDRWFSFAAKPFASSKKQVMTKRFMAVGLHELVADWKCIYNSTV